MEKVARIASNVPQTAKESEWAEPIRENRAEKNKNEKFWGDRMA